MRSDYGLGDRIARYRVIRLLGSGGHGRVYEAVLEAPAGLELPVALKVLRSGDGLVHEARIGGLLRHAHICDVFEVGEADGVWFCAMELCDDSLTAHLPLPPRAVVEVGRQVCAALDYAWRELGLIHLDIKPENLLRRGAAVKVADLGLARARGFDPGRFGGTPGYMAPEQRRPGELDPRADMHALGITLHVLATGSLPVQADTMDLDDIGAADGAGLPVPDWLAPVVARCTSADREDRFATMADLDAALGALPVAGPGLREHLGLEAPSGALAAFPPAPTDPLRGRAADVARLLGRLGTSGWTTLCGPAGIGKTRLAIEAVRTWRDAGGGRAWWCPVAQATDTDALCRVVAIALGFEGRASPRDLGPALAALGPAVLILDAFEGLAAHADVPALWLAAAPQLHVLVTSRVPVPGGHGIDVAPLDPDDAVALMADRAAARGADVSGDPALVAIARRLDGIPLALELAAGRIGVLPPREVLERLDLSLLRASDRDPRHATLTGALDAAWDLLDEDQRATLASLAVFRGGFTLGAAEAVVAPGSSFLDRLEELAARGLLRRVGLHRLDVLRPVAEHAASRQPRPDAVARHGAYFAALTGPRGVEALSHRDLAAFAEEVDNVAAAGERATAAGDAEVAVACCRLAWWVAQRRGGADLVLRLVDAAVQLPALATDERAWLELVAGQVHAWSGAPARAERHLSEALAIGAATVRGRASLALALMRRDSGDVPGALARMPEVRDRCRVAGDRRGEALATDAWGAMLAFSADFDHAAIVLAEGVAVARTADAEDMEAKLTASLGLLAMFAGRNHEAVDHLTSAVRQQRALGDRVNEAVALGNLAIVMARSGSVDEAIELALQAMRLARETGHVRTEAASAESAATLLAQTGRVTEAVTTFERAIFLYRALGHPQAIAVEQELAALSRSS